MIFVETEFRQNVPATSSRSSTNWQGSINVEDSDRQSVNVQDADNTGDSEAQSQESNYLPTPEHVPLHRPPSEDIFPPTNHLSGFDSNRESQVDNQNPVINVDIDLNQNQFDLTEGAVARRSLLSETVELTP